MRHQNTLTADARGAEHFSRSAHGETAAGNSEPETGACRAKSSGTVPTVSTAPGVAVAALVITHRPRLDVLRTLLAALPGRVAQIWVVDDASPAETQAEIARLAAAMMETAAETALETAAETETEAATKTAGGFLPLAENVGIATAINRGAEAARAAGATHFLLLDQDSLPAPDMVERLLAAEALALARGIRPAAVGPAPQDGGRDLPFVRFRFLAPPRALTPDADGCCAADFLVSSGMLIRACIFDAIGGMDETLFIDNVDLEWCFRAQAAGFATLGVFAARLAHQVGDSRIRLPGGIDIARHGPARLYYMMRNRVRLYRRPYAPRRWIAQDVPRLAGKFLIFSLWAAPRGRNALAMLRGLADGIRNRSGRYSR